jgi:hypothetical protein
MRKGLLVLTVVGLLVPTASMAKGRSEPLVCPDDVAAAIAAECPCAGPAVIEGEQPSWRNHGHYVRCVAKYVNRLRRSDCVTRDERRPLKRCGARSTCGKEGRVLCCVPKGNACTDPAPGDLVQEGVCEHDSAIPCDVDDDCTTMKAGMAADETTCIDEGGQAVGEGSVCTADCTPTP